MQRNPFGTYDNSVPVADCSLVEERAAFEALFPRGRAVRDTLVGLRIALCTGGASVPRLRQRECFRGKTGD